MKCKLYFILKESANRLTLLNSIDQNIWPFSLLSLILVAYSSISRSPLWNISISINQSIPVYWGRSWSISVNPGESWSISGDLGHSRSILVDLVDLCQSQSISVYLGRSWLIYFMGRGPITLKIPQFRQQKTQKHK